jgi:two-component system chemotaxis response regulator CheB
MTNSVATINAARVARDIVVIGASAGGVEALQRLLGQLPASLPAAVAIVIHRSPLFESRLPFVLGLRSQLPVAEPHDGDRVVPGHVYSAPRDQHLVFEDGQFRLNRGPKEHRTRPAIDPLFRSAAAAYGPRVLGVLLTGLGDDGVPGFIDIKAAGGLTLVQDPAEARYPSMPRMAIAEDDVDGVLRLDDLAQAITALGSGRTFDVPARASGELSRS